VADEQRNPRETKRVMDETLRRLLATPPDPHKPKAKAKPKKRK
jgi:hypothetical protein